MSIEITHLFECPEHLGALATLIHEEWWSDKSGHSVSTMTARLAQAKDSGAIPLSLVALRDGRPVGTVNLVENDNDERPDLTPWLAALLVVPDARGLGIGARLVRALLAAAARLGIPTLYLGTDIPDYYARLGASLFAEHEGGYRIMTIDTGVRPVSGPAASGTGSA